jgi:hypothetical protein
MEIILYHLRKMYTEIEHMNQYGRLVSFLRSNQLKSRDDKKGDRTEGI